MSRILTPALQIHPRVMVRRERELPLAGKVFKQLGESVRAEDAVAGASLPGNLQILRIAEKLGIQAFEVLKGLKVKAGDEVRKGDTICEHRGLFGLFRSVFVSPALGTIEYIAENAGHAGLREPARSVEIDAYLDGRIAEVREGKSAVVECEAAFLQGIFGVGGEKRGILKALEIGADRAVEEKHIPDNASGLILFGGTRPSAGALKLAAERGASGFVTGAIDDRALSSYLGYELGLAMTGDEALSMTVIITEGFGGLAMSERAVRLLTEHCGRKASINGATQVRAGAVRPEIIIPFADFILGKGTAVVHEMAAQVLRPGSRVRVIRYPWFGSQGVVVELPFEPARLETGAFSRVALIRLEGGGIITVSRANLELI